MRDDMAERFSEPRSRTTKNKYPRRMKIVSKPDKDGNVPKFKGMKHVHIVTGNEYWENGFGSDYSILRRFLASHVGEKWDDVYSEICSVADSRTRDGFRLREAVDGIVETSCSVTEDGTLLDDCGKPLFAYWRMHGFYVHPERKTLEYVPQKRRKKKIIPQTIFELDGNLYHKHSDGLWYRVEMKPVGNLSYGYNFCAPTDAFGANTPPKDLEGQRMWNWWGWRDAFERKYGLSPDKKLWYCHSKQGAGKRSINKLKKKHNLD
jgi:hypothetical protein